jgi:hypothetical protein
MGREALLQRGASSSQEVPAVDMSKFAGGN